MKARDYEIVAERFNINVNVFGYENKVFPLYVFKKSNEQVLNMLLISNEEKSHYVFIKHFNRLMYSQIKIKNGHKNHFCMLFLQSFTTKEILNNHKKYAYQLMALKQLNMKLEQLNLKPLIRKYLYHLIFMPI